MHASDSLTWYHLCHYGCLRCAGQSKVENPDGPYRSSEGLVRPHEGPVLGAV